MKPAFLALALLLPASAQAGLGEILDTTYLVLCKHYSPQAQQRLQAMPADQRAEVSRARFELLRFFGDFQNELHRFQYGPYSKKELREKLSEAEREALSRHFVNTCGMAVLLEQPMTIGGCISDGGADMYQPLISRKCAWLMNQKQ